MAHGSIPEDRMSKPHSPYLPLVGRQHYVDKGGNQGTRREHPSPIHFTDQTQSLQEWEKQSDNGMCRDSIYVHGGACTEDNDINNLQTDNYARSMEAPRHSPTKRWTRIISAGSQVPQSLSREHTNSLYLWHT